MALGDPGQPVGSAVEPDSTQLCGLERVALPLWSDRGVISRLPGSVSHKEVGAQLGLWPGTGDTRFPAPRGPTQSSPRGRRSLTAKAANPRGSPVSMATEQHAAQVLQRTVGSRQTCGGGGGAGGQGEAEPQSPRARIPEGQA